MKRRDLIKLSAAAAAGLYLNPMLARANFFNPEQRGPFKPSWDSLSKYQVPDWFRDAKFGMWAHWGPQCEPESGDWYARGMYQERSWQYKSHIENF